MELPRLQQAVFKYATLATLYPPQLAFDHEGIAFGEITQDLSRFAPGDPRDIGAMGTAIRTLFPQTQTTETAGGSLSENGTSISLAMVPSKKTLLIISLLSFNPRMTAWQT